MRHIVAENTRLQLALPQVQIQGGMSVSVRASGYSTDIVTEGTSSIAFVLIKGVIKAIKGVRVT